MRRRSLHYHRTLEHERIRRRIRCQQNLTLLRITGVVALCFLIWVLLTAETFDVRTVHITGLKTVPRERVEPIAHALIGQNFFRANTRATCRHLLQLPPIRKVRIHRALAWGMKISIVERQPYAAIPDPLKQSSLTQTGKPASTLVTTQTPVSTTRQETQTLPKSRGYSIIDGEGLVFRHVAEPDQEIVVFRYPQDEELTLGKRLPEEALRALRRCLTACDDAKLARPSIIENDAGGGMTVTFADGLVLQLGSDAWEEKFHVAKRALQYVQSQGKVASVINLENLEGAWWKPRSDAGFERSNRTPTGGTSRESGPGTDRQQGRAG